MADTDLLFRQPPISNPADLIFGEVESLPDVTITLDGTLPGLTFNGLIGRKTTVDLVAALPSMSFVASVKFNSATDRPLVGQTSTSFQQAEARGAGAQSKQKLAVHTRSGAQTHWQQATRLDSSTTLPGRTLSRLRTSSVSRFQDATALRSSVGSSFDNMLSDRRQSLQSRFKDGERLHSSRTTEFQDRYRTNRPALRNRFQEGAHLNVGHTELFGKGVLTLIGRRSRFQEAMRPPAGKRDDPVIPPVEPCYTPSTHLLFSQGPGTSNLLFWCENHDPTPPDKETVVVPIRSVYMVINDVTLKRVSNNTYLPALSLSLRIDVDSWTWSFSASLPALYQSEIEPDNDGMPVEVEIMVNGAPYRMYVEKLSRERTHGKALVSISGRGKNTLLSSPYTPIMTFANSSQRTAQQLMGDVLTVNGIPLGWSVDWQLTDWLVPSGAFNVNGSYIDGLNAIVGAAGGYIQPDDTNETIRAMLRYPYAPWEWGGVTPDYELPSAVTVREGIEWSKKAAYNRVFVSGQQSGILGQVTRAGTAGDVVAPMVTDPLITAAAAARQRGIAVLSDTGRQALVDLRLPVLQETGIIKPGAFVRYVDGGDVKLGIVRGTSVDMSWPELWQSISVETHE